MMQICKHCQKHNTCKKLYTPDCSDYNPLNMEVLIQEEKDRKTTPERIKELQDKIDYFYYGENTHRNYEKAKQLTTN